MMMIYTKITIEETVGNSWYSKRDSTPQMIDDNKQN